MAQLKARPPFFVLFGNAVDVFPRATLQRAVKVVEDLKRKEKANGRKTRA